MKVTANGIQIEVDDVGGKERPVVLLIMGLGMQLIAWPDQLVEALVESGFRVVRHDNRDIGLSQGFDEVPPANLVWQGIRQRLGLRVRSAYTLQDMAADSIGVLDALEIESAHVIGASMGGMIAQRVAATAPHRVTSLVSIMSSSGARNLPGPRADVAAALFRRPASNDETALVTHSLGLVRLISSPAYRQDEGAQVSRITRALRRAYRPTGVARQMLAVGADLGREEELRKICSPTLVLHGDADPLVPIACGMDTAARIPGAQFIAVPGMGHDLPPQVVDILLKYVVPFLKSAEDRA
ncbi:MAG: alpha/beta hydrolase [Gammaproteobacteria bacterium]|nr:alpha/beta hydrolase [Gammaproteobacteria bacterium]MBU1444179.1 alpha/beta hydrolase [Gammaproteobacteria bacterium]MBU2285249.1 alpha/beta hydrolase [Gammaproteobacteria bacterium]MBU2410713.1 alpha/beta hydrolase [Gammaproteobacteria bacterium]